MSCRMQIPLSYQNQTNDLVRNWATNRIKDLQPPNLSPWLNFDPSDLSQIYNVFVKACKITSPEESLLCYLLGETFLFISAQVNPDFSRTPASSPLVTDIGGPWPKKFFFFFFWGGGTIHKRSVTENL